MKEISGDIGPDNLLTFREKLRYLAFNLIRGLRDTVLFVPTKRWSGRPEVRGTDSPSRTYVDAFLTQELPKLFSGKEIRVLDIGCGTGYIRAILEQAGFSGEYVGVDVYEDEGFAQYNSTSFTSRLIRAPIAEAAIPGEFNLVISNTALEHIPDDRLAVSVGYHALVPGGVAVHIVPSFWSLFLYLFHGYRQYTGRSLRRVFKGVRYTAYRLGGAGSFLVHLCFILLPERFLGFSVRQRIWYGRALRRAYSVDRMLPFGASMYGVILRKEHEPQKRKVLFMLPSLSQGGIESQLVSQLREYDRSKFSLGVLTLFTYPHAPSLASSIPNDVCLHEMQFSGVLDLRAWGRVLRTLHGVRPDLVVSSMFSANTLSRALKPVFGYVSIAREHNLYDEKSRLQHFVDKILSHLSWRVVAVSHGVADFTAQKAGISREKLKVIPNGVPVERMRRWAQDNPRQSLRELLGFHAEEQVFLTVGRLKHWKNHTALIHAFEKLASRDRNSRLVIIGYGAEQERIENEIRMAGSGRVSLVQATGTEVWQYYAASDWFVLPSLKEGFPNVVLEALAFGLPVLTTSVPGAEDCIRHEYNGFFMKDDEESIHRALELAANCSPDTYRTLSENAFSTADTYDISRIAKEYERCFTEATRGIHL